MKKIIVGIIALLALSIFSVMVAAQTEGQPIGEEITIQETVTPTAVLTPAEVAQEIELPENETVSVGPDKPLLWGLKRAIERIDLALTFDKAAKAKKGLAHARERLLEVRQMIKEKRIASAEKAKVAYSTALERVKAEIKSIEEADPNKELEKQVELEKELEKQEDDVDKVETELEVKVKDNLTEEQQAALDTLIATLKNETGKVKIVLGEKNDIIKVKLKAQFAKTDAEIEKLMEQKREELNLTKLKEKRAELAVARFEKFVEKGEERIKQLEEKGVNTTALKEKLATAEDLAAKAKALQETKDFKGFKEVVDEAKDLSKEVREGKPFEETGRARAAAVIARNIEKLQERQAEGKNVSNAIEKLQIVEKKLQEVKPIEKAKAEQLKETVKEIRKEKQEIQKIKEEIKEQKEESKGLLSKFMTKPSTQGSGAVQPPQQPR